MTTTVFSNFVLALLLLAMASRAFWPTCALLAAASYQVGCRCPPPFTSSKPNFSFYQVFPSITDFGPLIRIQNHSLVILFSSCRIYFPNMTQLEGDYRWVEEPFRVFLRKKNHCLRMGLILFWFTLIYSISQTDCNSMKKHANQTYNWILTESISIVKNDGFFFLSPAVVTRRSTRWCCCRQWRWPWPATLLSGVGCCDQRRPRRPPPAPSWRCSWSCRIGWPAAGNFSIRLMAACESISALFRCDSCPPRFTVFFF